MEKLGSRLKLLLLLGFMSIVFISLFFFSKFWNQSLTINAVHVNQTNIIPKSKYLDRIEKIIANRTKDQIDLLEIKKEIKNYSYVKDVKINYKGKDELNVEINERSPVGIYKLRSGDLKFFDNEGVLLPFYFKDDFQDFYVVNYLNKNNKKNRNILKGAGIIIESLKKRDKYFEKLISEIKYNDQKGYVLSGGQNGIKFIIGKLDDANTKFKKAEACLRVIARSSENVVPDYFDLRWNGQIIFGN